MTDLLMHEPSNHIKIISEMNFCFEFLTDAIGNLGGFFDNLATNLQTMESRNLLPNQLRLLGENENRPKDFYGFVNSVRFSVLSVLV